MLILGGTQFVGRHFVEDALALGHQITLVHRGKTGGDLFPECRHIHMDRGEEAAWASFPDQTWDAVVDFSAYVPRVQRYSSEALKGKAKRYLFISTISVYDPAGQATLDEDSPLLDPPAADFEVVMEAYGGLKVACERVVIETWGEASTIVRPGMIIGPYDHTNRFQHWMKLMSENDSVDVPRRLDQPCQYIDARDLGGLILSLLEADRGGIYNAVGPAEPDTLGGMLGTIKAAVNPACTLNPVDPATIEKAPFLLPEDGSSDAMFKVSAARAIGAGLTYRSLETTVRDI